MNILNFKVILAAGLALTLGACGGGGESGETPPPSLPTVSFAAANASITEGGSAVVTVNLSAAASGAVTVPYTLSGSAVSADFSAAPVSPLTIAAGTTSASLTLSTVNDTTDEPDETVIVTLGTPSGASLGSASTSTVTILDNDDPPPATGNASISGRVTDAASGNGIQGVTAKSGASTATTAADGSYALSNLPAAASTMVTFDHPNFAPQSRNTEALSTDTSTDTLNVPMLAVAAIETYDPATAKTVSVPGMMAQAQMQANSLRTASGAMPNGMVTAMLTPIEPAGNLDAMPGNYRASMSGGGSEEIESFGALDARFVDASGNPLNLASGMSSTLRIDVSSRDTNPPASIPLYFFNPQTGMWVEQGTATLQGTAPNQFYEGTVTHFSTWNADKRYDRVSVSGCVQDAAGAPVSGAVVRSEGKNYTGSSSTRSDASGNFTLFVKRSSQFFLQASKGRNQSNSPEFTSSTANSTLSQCLTFTNAAFSIKLTWGETPRDLDSHTNGANSSDHIYYASKGSLTALPFVGLDVDDVSGFGPEVTTVSKLAKNRRYKFYVDNYSRTYNPGQTGSPARVEVLNNGAQSVFTPPGGETSSTRIWHVFDFTTDANCAATLVPVQQFLANQPANANTDNSAQFCN